MHKDSGFDQMANRSARKVLFAFVLLNVELSRRSEDLRIVDRKPYKKMLLIFKEVVDNLSGIY